MGFSFQGSVGLSDRLSSRLNLRIAVSAVRSRVHVEAVLQPPVSQEFRLRGAGQGAYGDRHGDSRPIIRHRERGLRNARVGAAARNTTPRNNEGAGDPVLSDAPVRFVVEVPASIVRALIFSFCYLRFDQRDDLPPASRASADSWPRCGVSAGRRVFHASEGSREQAVRIAPDST